MIDAHHGWNTSFKPVIWGFSLSLILTIATYFVAIASHLTTGVLTFIVMGLGSLQALIQLVFFLHLGIESKPRWSLMMFLFMALVMVVLVGGSLWIMYNLNYHVMPMMER